MSNITRPEFYTHMLPLEKIKHCSGLDFCVQKNELESVFLYLAWQNSFIFGMNSTSHSICMLWEN
jgi:hypothetical protein